MKTREDFRLELGDLKSIILDEVRESRWEQHQQGEKVKPVPTRDEEIDNLLQAVYRRIESQALQIYKSNEVWALKAWAYSNLLKDTVASEVTEGMVEELISPLVDHCSKGFDPIKPFMDKLNAEGRPAHTIGDYMRSVARFIAKEGKKKRYPDSDVMDYFAHFRTEGFIRKHKVTVFHCPDCDAKYEKQRRKMLKCPQCGNRLSPTEEMRWKKVMYKPTAIYAEYVRIYEFLKCINGKKYEMPIKRPDIPESGSEDIYQPLLSAEELETLIFNTLIDTLPVSWIVRLCVSTLYGGRVSELADIESKYIHLNGENSSIFIKTRKKGERKAMPIPQSLVPIFNVPIQPMPAWKLQRALKTMCKQAEVELPENAGWHALRRGVITGVYEETTQKELPIRKYFRWSTSGRQLGMLPVYVRTETEDSDKRLLAEHPILKTWEIIVPYLLKFHPVYSETCSHNL